MGLNWEIDVRIFLSVFGLVTAFVTVTAHADQFHFSDYRAPIYEGPRATIKLDTPALKKYRTRIRDAYKGEINFGGQYIVTGWGCGTDCGQGVAIDVKTGKVSWLPITITYGVDLQGKDAWQYEPDSRLFVMVGKQSDNSSAGTYYFLIDQTGMIRIGSGDPPGKAAQQDEPVEQAKDDASFLDETPCASCGSARSYFYQTASYWTKRATDSTRLSCRASVIDLKDLAECLAVDNPVNTPPLYPVDQSCTDHSMGSYCINIEQSAYDFVKLIWSDIAPEARSRCAERSSHLMAWHYTALQNCVQTDRQVKDQFAPAHFQP